ncbi:MAG: LTA synthase family protein, partial [Ruminococcus sp.]|nr:LTA synthase family protein [Ruminococcus sp.]
FLDELEKIDEPTLVFFVGDHFPSLRGETSVYNQLNLTGENCGVLYEQKYFLWSNYGADYSSVPENEVSFFYMPYVIFNIIDAPHDAFIEKMMNFMEEIPVYSSDYDSSTPNNEELDVLTYDRVVGDVMSPCPIPEEILETSKEN